MKKSSHVTIVLTARSPISAEDIGEWEKYDEAEQLKQVEMMVENGLDDARVVGYTFWSRDEESMKEMEEEERRAEYQKLDYQMAVSLMRTILQQLAGLVMNIVQHFNDNTKKH